MDRPPEIICCGSVVLDYVFEVEAIPQRPVKVPAGAFREMGGGLAATAAVAIAALGASVEFWGRVGADSQGDRLIDLLRRKGVDPRIDRQPQSRTPISGVIADPRGERLLAFFPGEGLNADSDWLPLDRLEKASAVLCDVRWPSGAKRVLNEARTRSVPSVLDADVAPVDDLRALVGLSGHALFSMDALSSLVGQASPEEALRRAKPLAGGIVGVTLGAKGFMWIEGKNCLLEPGFPVEVADTNGAGDTFHGAYALAIARGSDVRSAARFANAAAALRCTKRGSWEAMPAMEETLALLKEADNGTVPG